MCISFKFEKATATVQEFRSPNKVWVNWDDLQGNDSTRATGATLTCSQQRRWLDSVKSVFRENRRHLGLSQVLRRGRGLLLRSRARDYNTLKYSSILLLRLPSSRLAVNFRHSRIVAAALLSSFFCHQLKRIKMRAETKTIHKGEHNFVTCKQLFWKKNTQKRSFFFFSWAGGWGYLSWIVF